MTNPQLIQINRDLGLVINHELGFFTLSLTPKLVTKVIHGAKDHPGRLYAPIPLYFEAGIPFCLNSDGGFGNNVTSLWASVWVATDREQWPGYGDEFSISREDALRAATMGGAYNIMMDDRIGSIEPGKLADLAVLSADPLTCPPEDIQNINSLLTIVDGKIVYER